MLHGYVPRVITADILSRPEKNNATYLLMRIRHVESDFLQAETDEILQESGYRRTGDCEVDGPQIIRAFQTALARWLCGGKATYGDTPPVRTRTIDDVVL